MFKKDLRKKYMDLRKTLSKDEVLSLSQKIFENFVLQFNVIENQKVHIFFPIEKFEIVLKEIQHIQNMIVKLKQVYGS